MFSRMVRRSRQRITKTASQRRLLKEQLQRPGGSRKLSMQSLEDRRLLAVVPITADETANLRDAVSTIDGFAARLQDFSDFATDLPMLEAGIGQLANLEQAFGETIVSPVQQYLNSAGPNVAGLIDAVTSVIDRSDHITGSITKSPTDLAFTVDVSYVHNVDVQYDLADTISADLIVIDGALDAQLEFTLDFNITFGIEGASSPRAGTAFIEFDDANVENQITAAVTFDSLGPDPISIGANVGFLGVKLQNPAATLNLNASFDTVQPRVNLAVLTKEDLVGVVSIDTPSTGNSFDLTLDIQADIAGLAAGSSNLSVGDTDLFDTTPPTFDVNAFELAEFRTVSAGGFFGAVQQIQNTLGGINAFDTAIPFTGGKSLSDIVNVGAAISANVTGVAQDPENQDQPGFTTAQQFADKVADHLLYIPGTGDAPAELLFDISFDHVFDVTQFPIDFAGGIGELSIETAVDAFLDVDAELAAALEIGVLLQQPGAGFGFSSSTTLASLRGGKGIPSEAGQTDLRITLRDGTSQNINLDTVLTIGQLISELTKDGFAGKLEVSFDQQPDLITGGTYNQGLILLDKTASVAGSKLKLEMLNGSLAGPSLGLFGTGMDGIFLDSDNQPDESKHGVRTGALHGQSLTDNVFIRPRSGESMFLAAASLTADISAEAQLGFLEIGIEDGTAVGRLSAEFTPTHSETYGRVTGLASEPVTLGEAYSGDLSIELYDDSGTPSTVTVPFRVQTTDDVDAVVARMNANLAQAASSDANAAKINVGSVDGYLVFSRTDDVDGFLKASAHADTPAGKASLGKLGVFEDVTNGRISGTEVLKLASDATLRLQANKPITVGEAYSGNLNVEIDKVDGSTASLAIPFAVSDSSNAAEVAVLMNLWLLNEGITNEDAKLVKVFSSGDKLSFTMTDGVGRTMTVKSDSDNVKRLGIKENLAGYITVPRIAGSAHFDLPFTVNLDFGNFALSAPGDNNRIISFDIPDLTVDDFSLPDNFNLDLSGIGEVGDYLNRLRELDFGSVVESLQFALDTLRDVVEQSPMFNEQLPLLDTNLNTILDVADVFADIAIQMNANPAAGLAQFDEMLEFIVGLPENAQGDLTLPNFPVSIVPALNLDSDGVGRVFAAIKLDQPDDFPADGVMFGGVQHNTLKSFLKALQADKPDFGLTLDTSGSDPALRIDLPFDIGQQFGIEGQVDPLSVDLPINIDLDDVGFGGLSRFVDASGAAKVTADALGQIKLAVGLDLPETGAPRPFLYDGTDNGTTLGILVNAGATDIKFDVAIGPIGATLEGGGFQFGSASDPTHLDANDFANFSVGIADDNGDGRHYFSEIVSTVQDGLDLDDFAFSGGLSAELDAELSFTGLPIGPYAFDVTLTDADLTDGDIGAFELTLDGTNPKTKLEAVKDLLRGGEFNALALVGGWEGAFDLMIDAMEGEVFGVELPFVGDKLKDQANFLRDIKDSVSANFADNAENAATSSTAAREALLDAIGPNGINLLKDITGDNEVTIDDIKFTNLSPGVGFEILLGSDLAQLDLPIGFDLGIPGLNLDVDANVTGALGFELGLNFGVDLDHGFFIDTTDSFLEVFVDVGVPGLSASGELGFLRLDANEILTPAVALVGKDDAVDAQILITSTATGSPANFDVRIVQNTQDAYDVEFDLRSRQMTVRTTGTTTAAQLVQQLNGDATFTQHFSAALPAGRAGAEFVSSGQRALGVSNSFAGRFTVDILDPGTGSGADGLLTLGEILAVKSHKEVINVQAVAQAALDLHLLASFGGSESFPSIQTDLAIDWDFAFGAPLQLPVVEFQDISLDLGQFFSGFAETALEEVDNVLEPVRPIVDFLSQRVPVVSELAGGDITMLDLLKLEGGSVAKAAAFIQSAADFDRILQSIPDLGEGNLLNMGGAIFDPVAKTFSPTGTAAEVGNALKNLTASNTTSGFNPDDFIKSAEDLANEPDSKIKLGFPLLDPKNLMGLLSGNVVNLFTLELPTLELDASIKKYFPLPPFPVVGVELAGGVKARADFAFGFDTFGIQQFQQTGDFEDVFNGFFVFDHETADGGGDDIDELVLSAYITAAASLNAGIIRASVGGGLFANVDFNLHDNDEDGKIRLVELLDNTLLGLQDGAGPIHIFDVDGKLDAKLFAEVSVGLGPFSYTENFTLAEITLFEFEIPRPAGEGVPLAELQGTTLVLNVGDRAGLRDPSGVLNAFGQSIGEDQAENYKIFAGTEPGSVIVQSFGRSQIYKNVSRITGDAGIGNDKIVVSKDVTIPVELSGGIGNDILIGGSGNDILRGGAGNDDLRGELGDDTLEGGVGQDTLRGEGGEDTLRGGGENDQLFGGADDDHIFGDEGSDTIDAGGGDDVVYAGIGFDKVYGRGGDDEIHGGADGDLIEGGTGGDTIFGDEGDDRILGNDGNDEIHGGIGKDVIRGGVGNDLIYGGADNDQLFGENSRDVIYGGEGNDLLEGGLGSDDLFGGLGNDKLFANVSDTAQTDEAGHLLVGGSGDDLIYASPLAFDNTIFGDGVNDELGSVDNTTDGNDEIFGGAGIDNVQAGGGKDVINTYAGNDFVDAGPGDDIVYAGAGNDFVIGGFGNDQIFAGADNDVVWGGLAALTDLTKFDLNVSGNFELPPRFAETEAKYSSNPANFGNPPTATDPAYPVDAGDPAYSPARFQPSIITPAFVGGLSLPGIEGDGRDVIEGGDGIDILFGGADSDVILGGLGTDYIDAGAGNDINVDGGAGNDVVRGGGNSDVLHGGAGIDHILGDGGDDRLFGDAGDAAGNLAGQRLFGGDGGDTLFAYAPTASSGTESVKLGDQLFGDAEGDTLNGNLRMELLVGGGGNDLLRGDYLAGPSYGINTAADQTGAADVLLGDGGEDKLFGGGGDDIMWGGPDTDYLDGQKGIDTQYGGGGNDLFVVSAMNPLQLGDDIIDGHFGNSPTDAADSATVDDNATDVMIINGSVNFDTIGLSQRTSDGQLRIDYEQRSGTGSLIAANRQVYVSWLDAAGKPLVEQFQVAGLGGNDTIGFAGVHPTLLPLVNTTTSERLDVSQISARGDWTSTLEGNSGDDLIIGSVGRDRASGGPGSDTVFGFAGDDRLLGDNGDGFSSDTDRLYAGQGNDDLTGGQGTNYLVSWSLDPADLTNDPIPTADADYGIFVDATGNLYQGSDGGLRQQESTGLNRMLGGERTDYMYGGTIVDFMYGRGGENTLFRSDGSAFESMGDGIPGDEWKEYARESDQIWYVGGTNANDEIGVNFVTEPGLLSDHHLITRLTDSNGNVTFDAQVRLDFGATDADGNPIWKPNDLLADYAALRDLTGNESLSDLDKLEVAQLETNLVHNLLPPEGDFQAIIIDALAGNDKIIVGPTVQKSVWVDAGAGDDEVTIRGGNVILADKAEAGDSSGLLGRNDTAALAYALDVPEGGVAFDALTIDHAEDEDWFRFKLPALAGTLNVKTASPIDDLDVQIFGLQRIADKDAPALQSDSGLQTVSIDLASSGLVAGTEYLLRVTTNKTPTIYAVEFDLGGTLETIDLGVRSDAVRRDIILGGVGNDILLGGPGEDWILGGAGNDVISGGLDRGAGDLLLGEGGDDTFQIIPDRLPLLGNQPDTVFDPASKTYLPTMNDEIDGGSGTDRMLYVGGDLDRRGFEVPDFAALRYNTGFHRYEFTSLVWDIGQQKFLHEYVDANSNGQQDDNEPDLPAFQRDYLFYQTNNVEHTQIELRDGDDSFHADPSYEFPGSTGPEEWGIKLGNFQQGATEAGLNISGGSGSDQLFGGSLDDKISGGSGDDLIVGSQGNDELFGGGGNDKIFGLKDTSTIPVTPRLPGQVIAGTSFGFSEEYRYELIAPFFSLPETGRPGVDLNAVRPVAYYSFDTVNDIGNDDSGRGYDATATNVTRSNDGISGGSAMFTGQSSVLTVGTQGIDLGPTWTVSAWFKGLVDSNNWNSLFRGVLNDHQVIVQANTDNLGVFHNLLDFTDSGYDLSRESLGNSWHQITAVGAAGSTMFYMDGSLVGESSNQVPGIVRQIGNSTDGNLQFADELDEVYLYDQALDAGQVRSHYESTQQTGNLVSENVFGLEGQTTGEQLSDLRKIGDFNDDGHDDFIASSDTTSYILLGPVELGAMERIDHYAEIIVDHAAVGRPAERFGDLDGDNVGDLAFIRNEDGANVVTVVFGGKTMTQNGVEEPWIRNWDQSFVAGAIATGGESSFRTIQLGSSLSSTANINVHLLELSGDGFDDLVVIADSSVAASTAVLGRFDVGHIFAGQTIRDFGSTVGVNEALGNQLASIRSDGEIASLLSTVAGDLNGDGIEELLFGNKSLLVELSQVTKARVTAANLPNSIASDKMTILLSDFTAALTFDFGKGANPTAADYAESINSQLRGTDLDGKVVASTINNRVVLESIEGGSDIKLSVDGGVNMGFASLRVNSDLIGDAVPLISAGAPDTYFGYTFINGLDGEIVSVTPYITGINHTYSSDLVVSLIRFGDGVHPQREITLFSNEGGSATLNPANPLVFSDNGGDFDPTGATEIRPDDRLSSIVGMSPNGTWALSVKDEASLDGGQVTGWGILLTTTGNTAAGTEQTYHVSTSLLGDLSAAGQMRATLFSNSDLVPSTPTALGDLNADGYDDFALATDVDLEVFYGAPDTTSTFEAPQRVTDIPPGNPGFVAGAGIDASTGLVRFGDSLYFGANDVTHGQELWRYNGETSQLVHDIYPGMTGSSIEELTVFNNQLYFVATDATHGKELWVYDGVNTPTRVGDINPGADSSSPSELTVYNGRLYFAADDGKTGTGAGAIGGRELWSHDGTIGNAPTQAVDITNYFALNFNDVTSSDPQHLTALNGLLYFSADDGYYGRELYFWDGTSPSLRTINNPPGANFQGGHASPRGFTDVNGIVHFIADDGVNGHEIWKMVRGNPQSVTNESFVTIPTDSLFAVGDRLFFNASDGVSGFELWSHKNGVTQRLTDIYAGSGSSDVGGFFEFQNSLHFMATDSDDFNDHELWRYNESSGLERVFEIDTVSLISNSEIFVHDDQLFFGATNSASSGSHLWHYDGSNPPERISDLGDSFFPRTFASLQNEVYFVAHTAVNGTEVWKYATATLASPVVIPEGNLAVQSGDFNRDGQMDLAISNPTVADDAVYVFNSFSDLAPSGPLQLGDASTILPLRDSLGSADPFVVSSQLDLNGDLIDDLVISTGNATSQSGTIEAGRLSVVYGSFQKHTLPTSDIIDLENFSVPGSGSFSVDTNTGRAYVYDNSGAPYEIASAGEERWFRFTTLGDGQAGDSIQLLPHLLSYLGVNTDLFDSEGGLIVADQSIFDLRNTKAGTYYLRVHDYVGQFNIRFDAPQAGVFHGSTTLPDRDLIRGGDGDDRVFGNGGIDRIFGGSGIDALSGELIEYRDLSSADTTNTTVLEERISQDQLLPNDPIVTIPNPELAGAVARQLGRPVTTSHTGAPQLHEPFLTSQLNSIASLNANGLGLTSVAGIQNLANLQHLTLSSNNLISDGDIASDGSYAILSGLSASPLTLDFGATVTLSGIAIYMGYGNRVDGNYSLVDDADNVLGSWGISGPTSSSNDGVDSFWLAFKTPVTTSSLKLVTSQESEGSVSFREIIAFRGGEIQPANLGTTAGGVTLTGTGNLFLAGHQEETGGDTSANPDVTGGNGGTVVPFTPTGGTYPVSGQGGLFGSANLSDGDVNSRRMADLFLLKNLQTLELSANPNITNLGDIASLTQLRSLVMPGTGLLEPRLIGDVEPNNSFAAPQNIDGESWSTAANSLVEQATRLPHVTIAGTGDGAFDYYSFTASAGSRLILDIDSNSFDTMLFLLDTSGTQIATSDDGTGPNDAGQGTAIASFIDTTVSTTGIYVAKVARYVSGSTPEGGAIQSGETYSLHVSVENHEAISPLAPLEVLANLQELKVSMNGLSPRTQNLARVEGQAINLTAASSGAWTVRDANDQQVASGTGTDISFTPTSSGVHLVSHPATGSFPLFVQNVAPEIQGPPSTIALNEGDSRTTDQLLAAAGLTITDAGQTPTKQVYVTDSAGLVTDLTTGSLVMNDDVINLDAEILDEATDVSVSFWLKTEKTGFQSILSAANQGEDDDLFVASYGTLKIIEVRQRAASLQFFSATAFNDNSWHHLVVVRESTSQTVSVFLDGKLLSAKPAVVYPLQVDEGGLVVGQEQDSVGGGFQSSQALDGSLNELAFWRRALSTEQIADIYNMGVVGNEADLAAYYPLNELGGDVAYDRSRHARHGVIRSLDAVTPITWATDGGVSATTFDATELGDYRLSVIVHDSAGASDHEEARIVVSNVAPTAVITPAAGLAIVAGQTQSLSGLASTDPGLGDLTYEWSVIGNDATAVPASSETQFDFTPTVAGEYTVQLTVRDAAGGVTTQTKIVRVNPAVVLPTALTGIEGGAVEIEASFISDLAFTTSATSITREYEWTAIRPDLPGVTTDSKARFAFVPTDDETWHVTLTVTDRIGAESYSTTVSTSVLVSNHNPVIQMGADSFGTEGESVTLSPAVTDPASNDSLSYAWTIVDENLQNVTLFTNDQREVSFTPADNGTYIATLTVTDGDGGTATESTSIAVFNSAPEVNGPSEFLVPEGVTGNEIGFEVGVFDMGGDADGPFTYVWDFGDGTTTSGISEFAGLPFTRHAYSDSGFYDVVLTVTDKDQGVGSHVITVEIENLPPANVAFTNTTPLTSQQGSTVTFTGTAQDFNGLFASDSDIEPLRGEIDFGDGTVLPVILRDPAISRTLANYTFTSRHIYDVPGFYDVTLTVKDDDGGETTTTTSVNVGSVVSVGLSSASFNEGDGNAVFTITLSQPVPDGESLSVIFETGNTGSATEGTDYDFVSHALNFYPHTGLVQTINVPILDDADDEVNETISASLSSLTFGTLGAGASNTLATIVDNDVPVDRLDFGDAPTAAQSGFTSSYPATLADDGARHLISELFLGSGVDDEADATPNSLAGKTTGGDDGTGTDDEDGIQFFTSLVTSTTTSTTSSLNASVNGTGKLDGWIDFNRDGDWDDAGEQIFTGRNVANGSNSLEFEIPAGALPGTTFARFRLSTAGNLSTTGAASDGEVEDYAVSVIDSGGTDPAEITLPLPSTVDVAVVGTDIVYTSNGQEILRIPTGGLLAGIVGSSGNDVFNLTGNEAVPAGTPVTIEGGPGHDVANLGGEGAAFNFDDASGHKLQNVETIDLSGNGASTLQIGSAALAGAEGPVRIRVDADDSVAFDGEWTVGTPVFVDGVFVHQMTKDGVTVQVENVVPHANPGNLFDVNRDGNVSVLDALLVINEMSRGGGGALDSPIETDDLSQFKYRDVTNDNVLSVLDALRVINEISRQSAEGESIQTSTETVLATDVATNQASRNDKRETESVDSVFGESDGGLF